MTFEVNTSTSNISDIFYISQSGRYIVEHSRRNVTKEIAANSLFQRHSSRISIHGCSLKRPWGISEKELWSPLDPLVAFIVIHKESHKVVVGSMQYS